MIEYFQLNIYFVIGGLIMSRVLIADDDKNIASACTNFLTNEKILKL